MALTVVAPIFHLYGGLSYIHHGVMIDQGMAGRSTQFGRLFENTLRWLAEPSLTSGKLGGYVQDPAQLVHPNQRRSRVNRSLLTAQQGQHRTDHPSPDQPFEQSPPLPVGSL